MSGETHEDRLRGMQAAIEMLALEATALGLQEVGHILGCAGIALEEASGLPTRLTPWLRLVHSSD